VARRRAISGIIERAWIATRADGAARPVRRLTVPPLREEQA
jgi:hypothetical protein